MRPGCLTSLSKADEQTRTLEKSHQHKALDAFILQRVWRWIEIKQILRAQASASGDAGARLWC